MAQFNKVLEGVAARRKGEKIYLLGAMVRRLIIFELANPSHLLRQLFEEERSPSNGSVTAEVDH
jgi:hypothetical protein